MGFCFFDSVAVGAAHALATGAAERVLILDWDVHHGNGTNAIFHSSRDVLFVSIHQSPLYPGTGPASDVGSGAGEGYTVNLPVPPGTGDAGYVSLVEHVVVPLARAYAPVAGARVRRLRCAPQGPARVVPGDRGGIRADDGGAAAVCELPLGLVLEGGYSVEALADSVCALMPMLDGNAPAPEPLPVDPLAAAALERLQSHWPGLTSA